MRLSLFFLTSILLIRLLPAAAQNPTAIATPTGWHVTVPAEGGLIFQTKVNGQGPYSTVFDTGAVNVMSANFAKQLDLKIEEKPIDVGAIGGGARARTVHVDRLTIGELNIGKPWRRWVDFTGEGFGILRRSGNRITGGRVHFIRRSGGSQLHIAHSAMFSAPRCFGWPY